MPNADERGNFFSTHSNAMSDLISELYSENFTLDSWPTVLNLLGRAVPFTAARLLQTTTGQPPRWIAISDDPGSALWRAENTSHYLALAERAAALRLSVWRPAEVLGQDFWDDHPIRHQILKLGVGDLIAVTCDLSPDEVTHFGLSREEGSEDFSANEAFLLRQVRHHYMQAARLRASRLKLTMAAEVFRQVMRPGFTCDSSGRMIDRNSELRRFISENPLNDEDLVSSLEQTAGELIESGDNWRHIELGDDRGRLSVHRLRLQGTTVRYVAVLDSHQYFRRVLRHRMQDQGLSAREIEICALLIQGLSNAAIGEQVFISESTVKDHVASILDKFGVAGRNEVLNKLLGYDS